ncbi:MAG: hypothetical protein FJW35_18230 [Acidobacteria bacterium]|nr:hypothetical protein [Acidobacteriota bacterium]
MNEHESIRELLPLAAAGALTPEDAEGVRRHLARCETCRRVMEEFSALADSLRGLPTPRPRADLVAKVCGLAELRPARARTWRDGAAALAPLVAASWVMALVTWPLLKEAIRWTLGAWHVLFGGWGAALVTYSILGFLLACVAVFAAGGRASAIGRT